MIMNNDNDERVQDPMLPPDWFAWSTTANDWHARPPGKPNHHTYVHGDSKQAVADKAWMAHRRATDTQRRRRTS